MNEPCLYILCGLPFAGKTTLARALERQLGIASVELDAINNARGVGLHGEAILPQEWDETYAEAYRQLDAFLAARQSVLFDAASFTKAQRDSLRALAGKRGASSLVIYLDVSEVEARRQWLQNRVTGARYDVRDEDFVQVVNFFEPPAQEEQAVRYRPSQPAGEWIRQTFLEGGKTAVAVSLRYRALTSLPESLGRLTHLQHLDVTGNRLTALPESLGNLLHLKKLYADENRLTALPESFWQLIHLQSLNLAENQLASLSESIGNLTDLHTLDLGHNELTALPESLGKLTKLKELHAMNNRLVSLPESIGHLKDLKELRVSNNRLTALPGSLANLTRLTHLDLRNSHLKALPESLGSLGSLTHLDVRANRLISLPASIGDLAHLEKLHTKDESRRAWILKPFPNVLPVERY